MHFDAVIVGGGMVGAAAALGLAQGGLQVAVLEQGAPAAFVAGSVPDVRVSAIGQSSVRLLEQLGVWPQVLQMRSVPYRRLETWEWENAQVKFDASELNLSELGFMVENRVLQLALWQSLMQAPNVTVLCPWPLSHLQREGEEWILHNTQGERLHTPLVIGADGAHSNIRHWAGIGITGWQYRQSCMLISAECAGPPQDITWQQFTPAGPRAFLPLFEGWCSLVWYDSPQRIRQLQAMPLAQLNRAITEAFPARLAPVNAVATGAFALVRRHAQRYVLPGLALIGDAAHTINPLAGQGVNLGYRDVSALLDVVLEAHRQGNDGYHREAVLRRYEQRRRADNLLMQSGMDLFYKAFSNRLAPVEFARNVALMAAQRAGKLKQHALRYALGL
ncbi:MULTISPECIES: 3-demethoxyubiquinol 3-hydroxylase [Dickeya]|uniref:2-octaprenyl-3-methyl-6-methoxy-1,4-benzoquinol hydroxylase n=1 Tax=Dickeya aquatica TaxID=1401087 RepID=A0A375ACP4_9GAMM|nr:MULTISPECIES: 3-demethoxyubiquinol 3-hydroxylase [Dickeya]SLM63862.1 2-octaprenyl-3-methyl-6-methoxy-1,4-benzoquinol hydroxylase [Dickeya aquatica]